MCARVDRTVSECQETGKKKRDKKYQKKKDKKCFVVTIRREFAKYVSSNVNKNDPDTDIQQTQKIYLYIYIYIE